MNRLIAILLGVGGIVMAVGGGFALWAGIRSLYPPITDSGFFFAVVLPSSVLVAGLVAGGVGLTLEAVLKIAKSVHRLEAKAAALDARFDAIEAEDRPRRRA